MLIQLNPRTPFMTEEAQPGEPEIIDWLVIMSVLTDLQILISHKAAQLGGRIVVSLWKLSSVSATRMPNQQPNANAIRKF